MTDEDLGRLTDWLMTIAEMRGRPPPTPRVCAVFARLLGHYPYEVVDRAILAHLASSAAAYTSALQPAHIIAEVQRLLPASQQGTTNDLAEATDPVPKSEAWGYLQSLRQRLEKSKTQAGSRAALHPPLQSLSQEPNHGPATERGTGAREDPGTHPARVDWPTAAALPRH